LTTSQPLFRTDTDTREGTEVVSDNYYFEILFDYIEVFYKQALEQQSMALHHLDMLKKKLEQK